MPVVHLKNGYKINLKQSNKQPIQFESSTPCAVCKTYTVMKATNTDRIPVSTTRYIVSAMCPDGHDVGELIVTY